MAAGVPTPITQPSGRAIPTAARLVVTDSENTATGDAERGTIRLHLPTNNVIRSRLLFWGDLTVPLLGIPTVPLTLHAGDRVLARDEQGRALISLSAQPETVLHIGMDIGRLFRVMRFGIPNRANLDRDGNGEIQPLDLLPAIDRSYTAVPFQDLFIERALTTLEQQLPCPFLRTRGLPAHITSLLVLTADQDYASDATVLAMAEELAAREARATFLLTDPHIGHRADMHVQAGETAPEPLSHEAIEDLLEFGHDFGAHPFPAQPADIRAHAVGVRNLTGMPALLFRNHHLRWFGYQSIPETEASSGGRMNLDVMPIALRGSTLPCVGFPAGSAHPIHMLADEEHRLPVLQQMTIIDDYSLRRSTYAEMRSAVPELLEAAHVIIASARRQQVPIVVNAHPTIYKFAPDWLNTLLEISEVRTFSGNEWLSFVTNRRNTSIPARRCVDRQPLVLPAGVELRHH